MRREEASVTAITFEQRSFRADRRRWIILDEILKKADQRKIRREQIRFGIVRLIIDDRLKMIIVGERLQFRLFDDQMMIGSILRRREENFGFFSSTKIYESKWIRRDAGRVIRRCFDDVVLKEPKNQFDVIQRGDFRQNGGATMRIREMKILFDGIVNLRRTQISVATEKKKRTSAERNDERLTFVDSVSC